MQYLTQPLSYHELSLETGCHIAENSTTTVFEPQDWTCKYNIVLNSNPYLPGTESDQISTNIEPGQPAHL
jgi:hypothetical protein